MNLILGNGINYEQFDNLEWSKFEDFFVEKLQNNFAKLPKDGYIREFVRKLIISVLNEKDLESKLAYSDLEWVGKHISLDDWMWLTCNDYFDPFIMDGLWKILNGDKDTIPILMAIGEEQLMMASSTLSMIYFTSVHMIFNDSIHDTLKECYKSEELFYNRNFIKWLKGFDIIFSLNVDGILNKEDVTARFPHGFLNYKSPIIYYERQMSKVKKQDPEMFREFAEFAKNMKTNPYEMLFNYSSGRKRDDLEFTANFLEGDYSGYNHPLSEKVGETLQENKDLINIDYKCYNDIQKWIGDVIIIGVSLIGDEVIFELLNENEMINKIYFYGDEDEYNKVKSRKMIYMGFWSKSQYEF